MKVVLQRASLREDEEDSEEEAEVRILPQGGPHLFRFQMFYIKGIPQSNHRCTLYNWRSS